MANKKLIADLTQRDEVETAVAGIVAGILQSYKAKVQFIDPTIPPSQLDQLDRDLAAVLLVALIQVFKTEAIKLASQLDLKTINVEGAARSWAWEQTKKIVQDFRKETLARLQQAKQKQDATNTAAILATVLNPIRAVGLAATQITNASSAGELDTINQYRQQPTPIVIDQATGTITPKKLPEVEAIWKTRRDGKVCKKCQPLDNTTEDVWGLVAPDGPSLHPHCRCYIFYQTKEQYER